MRQAEETGELLEEGSVSIHFTTTETTDEKVTIQNWYKMPFKKDVSVQLQEHGRLPITKPDKVLQLVKENEELHKQKEELRK